MSRRPKKYPIPPLHFIMILSTVIITMVCLLLYNFAPDNKASLYATSVTTLIGFLVGKFSNSFGRPFGAPSESEQRAMDEDEATGKKEP